MILKNLRNILITALIIPKVHSRYPFASPELNSSSGKKCFLIGENDNGNSQCSDFEGYYIPVTDGYSDYLSFSNWINNNVENLSELNRQLSGLGCSGNGSSLKDRVKLFCNYQVYESLANSRCSENNFNIVPNYMCISECQNQASQLKSICPGNSFINAGGPVLESACTNFKNCGGTVGNNASSIHTNTITNNSIENENIGNTETHVESVNSDTNVIIESNNSSNNNNNENNINSNVSSHENDKNTNSSSNSIVPNMGNDNNIRDNTGSTFSNISKSDDTKESESLNRNILYTLGFMVPLSLFVGFGFIYYKKRVGNKSIDFEKESYSYHLASNNSGTQNFSENSVSSNNNSNINHKVFSIGLTDPKVVPTLNIPITNKNIDSREQDNIASNYVAELISTATMINAANNVNNNIQPITPNEVNININTTSRYNTLNSYNGSHNDSLHPSPNLTNHSNSSTSSTYNRKLPSYVINKNEEAKVTSSNANGVQSNLLKITLPTQLNPLSQKSPDSEASPIVDLSMLSESDPLIHIKKTNSFYHSSVSSESKKYNSFIAPISPIMSEGSRGEKSQSNEEHVKDENNENKQYTKHLLTNSILQNNDINDIGEYNKEDSEIEDIDENVDLEEENSSLRPSKIFSTDFSDINNIESSSRINNAISITVDDADDHSSKYSSAKIPLSVMTVVQEFEPRMEDELTLRVNDRILLLKMFDDGWAVGLNQMTGKQGVFPMEYVVSSELIKSTNKFASQIEYRNELPSRTQSQAFSNFSFTSTTINDSVIHLSDNSEFDYSSMSKSQSMCSSKYYAKNSMIDGLRKSKLNNNSVIES
ncbi:hypothetical protein BCR36DRAFT_348347 [Piromyces finnis]|uniref:SH3 domain-containing protein n=1 Tax=Piromyces finnis TaxID=1754191 RepID=A0A1Y1VFI6_9FUNG|nr:hypothetical protein BCR36DRAFT_348347 [Piromyces finnis]|eukprot:ORX54263.1 hypothetical protein BCR36DRAFT_348347 [Piromyces finnis]